MDLAMPSHAPPPPIGALAAQMASSSSQFITCTLGEAEYGIDIMSVREIKGWTETTAIPYAPPWIRGVINLRGTIVPILDLRARFRQEPTIPTPMHVVVIIQTETRTAGLLVDAVSDIITVGNEDIRPVPEIGAQVPEQLLSGLVPLERGMVALVSLQHLIAFQMDDIAEATSAPPNPLNSGKEI